MIPDAITLTAYKNIVDGSIIGSVFILFLVYHFFVVRYFRSEVKKVEGERDKEEAKHDNTRAALLAETASTRELLPVMRQQMTAQQAAFDAFMHIARKEPA